MNVRVEMQSVVRRWMWLTVFALAVATRSPAVAALGLQDGQPAKPPASADTKTPDQNQPAKPGKPAAGDQAAGDDKASGATPADIKAIATTVQQIKDALDQNQDPDFALVLGIGSLLLRQNVTDYQNQSNVLQATSLGRATPQLLAGVSFRTKIPSLVPRHRGCSTCELWEQRPWSAFVSLKFSPGSSQTINGYVLGGSFAIAHHVDLLLGYSLTPVNEPAPGFRSTAYQYVLGQQKNGQALNYNPSALAANDANAFDGFAITDANGKLIYGGNPLTVHYHGSTMIGVSVPVYFKSVFGK